MKKIKLLLLALITPLLCGVSFWINLTQDTIDYINSISIASWSNLSSTAWYIDLYRVPSPVNNSYLNYCVLLSWFNISSSASFVVRFNWNLDTSTSTPFYVSNINYNLYCATWWRKYFQISFNSSTAYRLDNFWVFNANDILNQGSFYDCSSIESQLNQCQSDLTSCQASNCDTQLSQCIIDRDNALSSITTLSWSLLSCNEDKASLQNYNDSLSSQLNACLSFSSSWDNLSWSACFDYSMFWQDGNDNYSLPITNNLFLPSWYKWKYNEDKIVSIAPINSIENALLFDDSAKETTVNSLAYIMLFLLATWLIMVLLRFLKKLFKL